MEALERVVRVIDEKHGQDIVVIDVSKVNPYCNYFVICSGNNDRQIGAIANSLHDEAVLEANDLDFIRIEGNGSGVWTLVDLNDIVVHIFSQEGREHYSLEKLWGDLDFIDISNYLL